MGNQETICGKNISMVEGPDLSSKQLEHLKWTLWNVMVPTKKVSSLFSLRIPFGKRFEFYCQFLRKIR